MSDKSGKKKHVSVVIIGHVDSGKSTTTGHLIYECGGVDKRTMEKLEKEANDRGKGSFKYAYLLDKTSRERESGITIDITQTVIRTPNTMVTVVDAPGHRDFLKNMITGASVADVAILVLPATVGEFEVAISASGSAQEHATLAFTMGVKTIMIAINKMDVAQYSKERFEECTKEAISMCSKIGYKKPSIAIIPISGLEGDNLVQVSANMPWFKGWSYETPSGVLSGKTIFDWCDSLIEPARPVDKPLRIVVDGAFKISGIGTVAAGRVESGTMKAGDIISASPSDFTTEVKSIEMHHNSIDVAYPGDNIGFNLKNIAVNDIRRGNVVGHAAKDPPRACQHFVAQTVVLAATGSKDKGFRKGFSPVCDAHTAHFQVKVENVVSKLDRRTGKEIQNLDSTAMSSLKANEAGIVEYTPIKPVCLEIFSEYPALGRLAIREARRTVAVCVVKKITKIEVETSKGAGKGGAKAGGAKAGAAKGKK